MSNRIEDHEWFDQDVAVKSVDSGLLRLSVKSYYEPQPIILGKTDAIILRMVHGS